MYICISLCVFVYMHAYWMDYSVYSAHWDNDSNFILQKRNHFRNYIHPCINNHWFSHLIGKEFQEDIFKHLLPQIPFFEEVGYKLIYFIKVTNEIELFLCSNIVIFHQVDSFQRDRENKRGQEHWVNLLQWEDRSLSHLTALMKTHWAHMLWGSFALLNG